MWWYQWRNIRGFLFTVTKNVSISSGNLLRMKNCIHIPVDPDPYVCCGSRQKLSLSDNVDKLYSTLHPTRNDPQNENVDRAKFQAAKYGRLPFHGSLSFI